MEEQKKPKGPAVRTEADLVLIRQAVAKAMKEMRISETSAHKLVRQRAMNQREPLMVTVQRYLDIGIMENKPRSS